MTYHYTIKIVIAAQIGIPAAFKQTAVINT